MRINTDTKEKIGRYKVEKKIRSFKESSKRVKVRLTEMRGRDRGLERQRENWQYW